MNSQAGDVGQLLAIMRRLRDRHHGCAWDVKQDFHSIAPFTVEEAYEVADAIEREDLEDLCDELGDLLFQVVFHAQMASEVGAFTFDDVTQGIINKMLRRHPHVFGDVVYETDADLKAGWEAIKREERRLKAERRRRRTVARASEAAATMDGSPGAEEADVDRAQTGIPSMLDDIPRNLPGLMRADKLQRRAARIGFDWPEPDPVWRKLDEEAEELRQAVSSADADAIEDELGDLLFTVVNLSRHLGVDAEQALHRANRKFDTRFRRVEQLAAAQGLDMQAMDLQALDALWDGAKADARDGEQALRRK